MLTKEAFAAVIKGLRKSRELSQQDISAVDRTYLSGLETAKRTPTIAVVQKIALFFDIDPALLVLLCSATGNREPVQLTLQRIAAQISLLERHGVFEQIASITAASSSEPTVPDDRTDKAVVSLRSMGLSHAEIAAHLKLSKSFVQRRLKRLGIS